MKAIVVVDRNWAIGKGNSSLLICQVTLNILKEDPWKSSSYGTSDLRILPEESPERTNIVLTTNEDYPAACEICCSKEQLFNVLRYDPKTCS